ncbi:hypothetical protein GCM10009549_50080 [Streptomyces thermoalcalitolerans]|uniref:Uncharacterized protein n=1 Tax=Streptomyces thermoalcalitolerans TaxID=65605 RepID=A0ABP4A0E3_9ACTN
MYVPETAVPVPPDFRAGVPQNLTLFQSPVPDTETHMPGSSPFLTGFNPIALGSRFAHHGLPCPPENRTW